MAMVAAAQEFPSTVLSRNKEGMEALRKGDLQVAFDQFKEAESLLTAHSSEMDGAASLLAVTCNNLGLYYKKVGKLHGALSYLRRALKMETDLDTDEVTLAGTHLNICAILSKLDKHERAVQHALNALDLVNKRIQSQDPERVPKEEFSVLAISYHTLAVERDCLQQFEKAAETFKKGHEVACQHLGTDHPLAISLGNNCDAVLVKSKKLAKASGRLRPDNTRMQDVSGGTAGAVTTLPPLPASRPGQETKEAPPTSLAMPSLGDAGELRDVPFGTGTGAGKMVAIDLDGDGEPDVMMSIAEAENMGHAVGKAKNASKDFRPSRMVKGSSRTAKLARRSGGVVNETTHRDAVRTKKHASSAAKEAYARNMAASMIQRNWRAYHKYCEDNAEWLSTIHACANMIQKVWRSYHVRRARKDRAAAKVQKVMRGALCRSRLGKRQSAVSIQRIAKGMIQRKRLAKWQHAGLLLTSLARGGLARCRLRARKKVMERNALKIQCFVRMLMAQRRVKEILDAKSHEQERQKAAVEIQRIFRGCQGRKRFADFSKSYYKDLQQYNAATKIQSMMRSCWATDRVEAERAVKLQEMSKAATHLRKMWLGSKIRRKYRELISELAKKEPDAVIIQRYVRGFLVRNRMWREAMRAEEELWAALEIQRTWRGYLGRVRWEDRYEAVWRREMKAAQIQRVMKGVLARIRVGRMKRRIARAEFERARQRFRSAQRIQAMVRGALVRRAFQRRFTRCAKSVVLIQRIFRGYSVRSKLWAEALCLRATMIQACLRGWIVRRRRRMVTAKVVCIQNAWRRYKRQPEYMRATARRASHAWLAQLPNQALLIDKHFRELAEERKKLSLEGAGVTA